MENNFNHKDFEHFLQENVDQYRMFPSENVWKGINNTLHTRRKWYGFGLGFLLLTTSVVTWVMLSTSGKNRVVVSSLPPANTQQVVKEQPKEPVKIILASPKPSDNRLSFVTNSLQEDLFVDEKNSITDEYLSPVAVVVSKDPLTGYVFPNPVIREETGLVSDQVTARPPSVPKQTNPEKTVTVPFVAEKINESAPAFQVTNTSKEIASIKEEISRSKVNDVPWTIESVINSYQYSRRRKKLSFELYVTPTISYRELKENKPFISWARSQSSGFTNATYTADINNVVRHKPDLGLQLGASAGLAISKKIRLIGGVQFNVSKYDIKAYTHPTEMATISLSTAVGGRNTVTAPSYYRNVGATQADWLRNLYISASAPLGVEVKLLGNRSNYFGVSGTMQPTYILSNKSYLLSTDYKNYAKFPSLTRKWNLNAGFEMFAGISTGKLKWRVGPQVRYQVMSSYQERYPIKEHLFDFGLKMGIMLNH